MADLEVNQEAMVSAATAGATPATTQEAKIAELDGLSEFTFQGQKYTPDQLHKMIGEYKTLSEQSKTYSENEKFEKNLKIDLDSVRNDPGLAQRFKQVYPQKYHFLVDEFLGTKGPAQAQSVTAQAPQLPKEFLNEFGQMKERLNFHEQRAFDAETQAASAKLDAMLPKIFEKYPLANEDQVYARAEGALKQKQLLNEGSWERFARESHEAQKKKNDQYQSAIMKKQTEKGQRGADSAAGGSTPGQAPVRPRTFDEAREAMIASMKSQRNG